MLAKAVGHPLSTFRDPALVSLHVTGNLPHSFVHCLADRSRLPVDVTEAKSNWRLETLVAGHWPMISQPGALVCIILTAPAPAN